MSNQKIRKFRKNDWSDDEYQEDTRSRKDKRKERRFERALRTKDISNLVEDPFIEHWDASYSAFEEEKL
jgi:hypothetical protein